MNTRAILLSSALMLTVFTGCQYEKEPVTYEKTFEKVSVDASILSTRTSADGLSPIWTEGDQVAFITADLELCPPFEAVSGGSTSTSFSGEKPEGSSLAYALYPYDKYASFSKSGIMTYLPSKQDGSFSNAIMVAEGNEADGFTFMNVCCLLKLYVPSYLEIEKIEVYREDQVSGDFSVDFDDDELWVHTSSPMSIEDQKAVIVGDGILSGEYYICVLPSDSKELSIAFTDTSGKVAIVSKPFSTGHSFFSGAMKDLGTVGGLSFGDAAPISDPTYSQL